MPVCFLEEAEIAVEAGRTFVSLDLDLHGGGVGGESNMVPVVEVHQVVGLALEELDAFALHGRTQIRKGLTEEIRQ
jgi:hypothetical protein